MKLYYSDIHEVVEVYQFFEDETVLIYRNDLAQSRSGNGWQRVPLSKLVTLSYAGVDKC